MHLVELLCGDGAIDFSVRRFAIREAISTCFDVGVWAVSSLDDVDLDSIVGRAAGVRLVTPGMMSEGRSRWWTGICCQAEQTATEASGVSGYYLRIVPPLWLLAHRKNHRVFQHKSVIEIVSALLKEWQFDHTWHLTTTYATFDYRVQYDESDLGFISRLLEESGISFYFDHSERASRLVFSDSPQATAPGGAASLSYLENASHAPHRAFATALHLSTRMSPGRHTIRDFDFRRRPDFPLFASATGAETRETHLEQYEYTPGAFVVETAAKGDTPVADDKGATRAEEKQGLFRATRALEAQRAFRSVMTFRTNAVHLAPGLLLTISGHPRPDLGATMPLLATDFVLEGTCDGPWVASVQVIPASVPFRPPMRTVKPRVSSVQSALVVGPRASEIHTDEFGRVRVQFPWDREGRYDDNSSCWIRVSQGWAGAGFGMIQIPRVGQEVLVGFLDGNPDQPVIVGRVFNNLARPSIKLPELATQTAWRSQSLPGGDGYNEIVFEDAKGKELVNIQAQRNLSKLVKVDETDVTGSNQTIQVGVNRSAKIGKVDAIVVGEKHVVTVANSQTGIEMTDQNISHSTGAASSSMSGGNFALKASSNVGISAGADIALTAGSKIVASAGADITLKAGGSISLEAGADVSISAGGSISIKGGGPVSIYGADVVIHGGTVKIN